MRHLAVSLLYLLEVRGKSLLIKPFTKLLRTTRAGPGLTLRGVQLVEQSADKVQAKRSFFLRGQVLAAARIWGRMRLWLQAFFISHRDSS